MLLTRQQAYILDLLSKLKCIKKVHLRLLLRRAFGMSYASFCQQMRQLCYMGKVTESAEFITLKQHKRDEELLTATDIMLEFCPKGLPSFVVGEGNCKLTFFAESQSEKAQIFKLFFVNDGQEELISLQAQNQSSDQTLLFYLQNKAQIPLLQTVENAFFVLKNPQGKYEFYK